MYVYILECEDGSFYTGVAKDLAKRMANHGKGSKYTRAKIPKQLVYVEESETALKREAEIKKLSRQNKEELVKADSNRISKYQHIVVG